MALSMDLRTRIVAECDAGASPAEVADMFSVAERTVFYLLALRRKTGDLLPRKGTGRPRTLEEFRDRILETLRKSPSLTLEELHRRLKLPGCPSTLWNALQRWGITLKKSHPGRRAAPPRRPVPPPVVGHSDSRPRRRRSTGVPG